MVRAWRSRGGREAARCNLLLTSHANAAAMGRLLLIFALLAGCSQPSPAFRGVTPVRVTVGESVFDVRVRGHHAQAIRLGPGWAPRTLSVAPEAAAAIAAASGCAVPRLWGDQGMLEAALVCGPERAARRGVARAHDCRVVPTRRRWTELVCAPRPGPHTSGFSMNTELAEAG
jgi:hypothetical protein